MDKVGKDSQDLNKTPINYSNAFRIGFTESEFNIDFGIKGNDEEITVVSSAAIPIKLMEKLIIGLLVGIGEYEEKYKTKVLTLVNDDNDDSE